MSDAPLRLALVDDFPEEGWTSMDLCADRLAAEWAADPRFAPQRICPPFRTPFGRFAPLAPGRRGKRAAANADRLWNRVRTYPAHLARIAGRFDLFHIVDHSYAHLTHHLPADRTGVFCHDLDAFRSLLDPAAEPRPRWFRAHARSVAEGLGRAAAVFVNSRQTRRELVASGFAQADRVALAPLGVCEEFARQSANAAAEAAGAAELAARDLPAGPFLLHVGSCIPRKRIDVLLEVFAAVRAERPELTLVQVGGIWTEGQRETLERLRLGDSVRQLSGLSRTALATLYRRSQTALQPSASEGFGLPVAEALACGAKVIASDLPVLREVGGPLATFAPVGDVPAWRAATLAALDAPPPDPALADAHLRQFTWEEHARRIGAVYERLAAGEPFADLVAADGVPGESV
ncbi:glycosyltransferase [Alienimonas californiensis]|uniref:D-inositol 3-phosphate glycosyltransferase n=1 Tax=Alienimonas californiensis TaxID=2527989 RepID=A0A517P804_9PLAN|nr:glycosyltransferase [Alienimonas californiensis]QDT15493.1 D-inositol 3-phosphate glycosyltransferase [Alienimonas californiensis]